MRVGIGKNIRGSTMLTEHIQNLLNITPFLTASIEFAI